MAIICALRPLFLNHLFGTIEPDGKAGVKKYFMIVVLFVPFMALYNSGAVVFRATRNSKLSMILCRIALSYVFSLGLGMGMLGTWAAMFVDWIAKSIIYVQRYRKGTWSRKLTEKPA